MRLQHTSTLNPNNLLRILVVGAGGTGSSIAMGLPYLDQAMRAWGMAGLNVRLMDADTVSPTNCVRQPFAVGDVGFNKATILINRINTFWGKTWAADTRFFTENSLRADSCYPNIVIGCVDSRKARQCIATALSKRGCSTAYWLDLGNNADSGQFVLGQPQNSCNRKRADRLRTAAELYPEIAEPTQEKDDLPSCSAIDSLLKQEPYINQTLANAALAMLSRLVRYRTILYHGCFYSAASGKMSSLAIDPDRWQKMARKNRAASRCAK